MTYCEYMFTAATRTHPAEFCDFPAEPDSDFCEAHCGLLDVPDRIDFYET